MVRLFEVRCHVVVVKFIFIFSLDNFNVYKWQNNYHKNYTVQGNMTSEGLSYRYEARMADGNRYSFIGADACLKPGLKRPFNFVGRFDAEELERIKRLKKESANSNYTIWFGHYPTSSIANNDDFRSLVKCVLTILPIITSNHCCFLPQWTLLMWPLSHNQRLGQVDDLHTTARLS